MRNFLLLISTLFFCSIIYADKTPTTVKVIVSNAQMSPGEDNYYVPTMFVNWQDRLPVQLEPTYELPNKTNVTVFSIPNWNYQTAQNTVINYQIQNDYYSSNCTQTASYFCTDSTCKTLKINMEFQNEAICAK